MRPTLTTSEEQPEAISPPSVLEPMVAKYSPTAHHLKRGSFWDAQGVPRATLKRLVSMSVIVGLISGGLGAYGFMRLLSSSASNGVVTKQALVLQESSAVIDVAKKVSPTVVSITSKSMSTNFFGQPQEQDAAGTGIIVSSDGLILTNKHVAADPTARYTVITSSGKQYTGAKVIAQDPTNDIAFLRITATGLPVATLGDSSAVQLGQQVVAIGNALGEFQNSVTAGIISGVGRPVTAGDGGASAETLDNLFQTDAAINPGNSGGPLVNLAGQIIGMNTAVAGQNSQNIGFAIPINEARPLVASVESTGKIIWPYLGVRYISLSAGVAANNGLPLSMGAWLESDGANPAILAGSPADKAGLKVGDIITKVNGKDITVANSLSAAVGQYKVGDKVTLTVRRGMKTLTISIVLAQAPAN